MPYKVAPVFIRRVLQFLVLLGVSSTPVAWGATYYVATNGNDSNPGTASQPFRTIQKAANSVRPGDTVNVMPGDYGGGTKGVYTTISGTATARIRFVSPTKWGAKITATYAGWTNEGAYVDIEGFDISGELSLYGILNWASNVRIINNHVHDIAMTTSFCNTNGSGGVGIDNGGGGSTGNEITGNVVHHLGLNVCPAGVGAHAIYNVSSNTVIAGNLVYRANNWGIMSYMPSNRPINVVIKNNVAHSNGVGGIAAYQVSNHKFYNNTVYNNSIVENGNGNEIRNNIVFGGNIDSGGSNTVLSNNLVGVNPKFVNASTGDFRLQTGSPGIDTGVNLSGNAVITDIEGVSRPQGCCYDMGAYEYGSSGTSPTLISPNNLVVSP
jgi:Right handed beta helix region